MALRKRVDANQQVAKKNVTGTTLPINRVVKLDATKDCVELPGATTDPIYGVTCEAIEDGRWGTVQVGPSGARCTAKTALATPGVALMTGTDGKVLAFSAGAGTNAQVVGWLRSTAAAEDDEVEVELAAPGTVHQG